VIHTQDSHSTILGIGLFSTPSQALERPLQSATKGVEWVPNEQLGTPLEGDTRRSTTILSRLYGGFGVFDYPIKLVEPI
jgi:hypothetical protein